MLQTTIRRMRPSRNAGCAVVGLLAAFVASCGGGTETAPTPRQASITISPTAITLPVSGGVTFLAAVSGASDPAVTWSATGGNITSGGAYTAPAVTGDYEVIAALAADPTVRARATVKVTDVPVVSLSVSPANPVVAVNGTLVFSARVVGGSTSAVDWSLEPAGGSAGSITADGIYTAPAQAGVFTVVATTQAFPVTTARAIVTVTTLPIPSVEIVDTSSAPGSPVLNAESRIFRAVVSGASQYDVNWSVFLQSSTDTNVTLPSVDLTGLYTVFRASGTPGAFGLQVQVTDRLSGAIRASAEVTVNVLFVEIAVRPTDSLDAGQTVTMVADITIDDGLTGDGFPGPITVPSTDPDANVNWSVTLANGGKFLDATAGLYAAPFVGGGTHTVVAQHNIHTTKSASTTVQVRAITVLLTTEDPNAVLEVRSGETLRFKATVSNVVPSNAQVRWSVQEGVTGGTITQESCAACQSGEWVATYQAPIRAGARSFRVVATSEADTSKRAVATVTILGVWVSVATGGQHTVGIKSDGTLWAWGSNFDGQLGDGSNIDRPSPVQIQTGTGTRWATVAAGASHTLALDLDGRLYAWGANASGQLGNDTFDARNTPVPIGVGWKLVSARGDHSVGIKVDGTLWAWGDNTYGQIGNNQSGPSTHRSAPTEVVVTDAGTKILWTAAAAGTSHSLAIAVDGSLWAWGRNHAGQLGDDSRVQHLVPVRIGTDSDWIAVDAGASHSAGVRGDPVTGGTLWTWGDNASGQLGLNDPATTGSLTPVQVGAESDWANVFLGDDHTFAVKSNRQLWGWGHNVHGELGLGAQGAADVHTPTLLGSLVSVQAWLAADSGHHHSAMVTSDAHLYTTGSNSRGQLGDGTVTGSLAPSRAGGASVGWGSAKLAAGATHNAAIKLVGQTLDQPPIFYGTLWTWGNNVHGQLGSGSRADRDLPTRVGVDSNWTQVSIGAAHTAALKEDGSLWTWGDNTSGQLGVGGQTERALAPVEVPRRSASDPWVGVTAGAYHTVAITRNGNLWAWGANGFGQLGRAPDLARAYPHPEFDPVLVDNPSQPVAWLKVSAGADHTLAIKREFSAPGIAIMTLWGWGRNDAGQVGDGTMINRSTPTRIDVDWLNVSLTPDWLSTTGGGLHSMGLKGAGELWGWGSNVFGQVGVQTSARPVLVHPGPNWQLLSAGGGHSAAIKQGGTLWTWGRNAVGQLGTGGTTDRNSPAQIGADTTWSTVASGSSHTVATKTDGTLWAWGANDVGQLGNGAAWIETPVEIP